MFDLETYNYNLPQELIAQVPAKERDKSRLLVVNRKDGHIRDQLFYHLPQFLAPGDLIVINDTKVVPAKLLGKKETGGQIEVLVLDGLRSDRNETTVCWCLMKASKRPKVGSLVFFDSSASARVIELGSDGFVKLQFLGASSVSEVLDRLGRVPLPPYIKRDDQSELDKIDRFRYQTIYGQQPGAVAAPTAGLHFTEAVFASLRKRGIGLAKVTLHVSYGTFQPVRTKDVRKHKLASEFFRVPGSTARAIGECKQRGNRVVAVGTTVVRTLESVAKSNGEISEAEGETELLITPGFEFKVVDALITNFHLPKSSLLFLVSAFGGIDLIRKCYEHAVKSKYRFYSYGDAMLIL